MGALALLRIGARALAQQLGHWAERVIARLDVPQGADDALAEHPVPDSVEAGVPPSVSADGPPADWVERVRRGAPWLLDEHRDPEPPPTVERLTGSAIPARGYPDEAKRAPPRRADAAIRGSERSERTRAPADAFTTRRPNERPPHGATVSTPDAPAPDARAATRGAQRPAAAASATARRPAVFSWPGPGARRPRADTETTVRERGRPDRSPLHNADETDTDPRTPPRESETLAPNDARPSRNHFPLRASAPCASPARPTPAGGVAHTARATRQSPPTFEPQAHATRQPETTALRQPRVAARELADLPDRGRPVTPMMSGPAAWPRGAGDEQHPWPDLPAEPPASAERATADAFREAERWRRVRLEQEGMPWSG
jgi:hypothetical protein